MKASVAVCGTSASIIFSESTELTQNLEKLAATRFLDLMYFCVKENQGISPWKYLKFKLLKLSMPYLWPLAMKLPSNFSKYSGLAVAEK